jgi:hypothetical protein
LQFLSGEFKLRLQMTYGTTEVGRILLGVPLHELKRSDVSPKDSYGLRNLQ